MLASSSFDLHSYRKSPFLILGLILMLFCGYYAGHNFNFNAGKGIFLNSPYTIGFMVGLFSLITIFIGTLISIQLLFIEWDVYFDSILFATPLTKYHYAISKFITLYGISLITYSILLVGFMIGHYLREGAELRSGLKVLHYIYPWLVFGVINNFLVCSWLILLAWTTKNKLIVALGGLLLYILYMIILLFSNSPFMAQSMPQSIAAQSISALLDPFGLSGYFWQSKDYNLIQRNTQLVSLQGYFLINRIGILVVSALLLAVSYRALSFTNRSRVKSKNKPTILENKIPAWRWVNYTPVAASYTTRARHQAWWSHVIMDQKFLLRQVSMVLAALLLLFYLGMEIYAEIEKGIRLPQKYASSKLMATAIIENFHFLGIWLVVYFSHEIAWRSKASNFSLLELSTPLNGYKMISHWFSMQIMIIFFSVLLIFQGLIFQWWYNYLVVDWRAYGGIFVYVTGPLILLSGWLVLINSWVKTRYLALGLSILFTLLFASPLLRNWCSWPLAQILRPGPALYSDFNGYGAYWSAMISRTIFSLLILSPWYTLFYFRLNWQKLSTWGIVLGYLIAVMGSAGLNTRDYEKKDKDVQEKSAAAYEINYRPYQTKAQPAVIRVKAEVNLFPNRNSYNLSGHYVLKNLSTQSIQKVLINFPERFKIKQAHYHYKSDTLTVSAPVSELTLPHALHPGDSAYFYFELNYCWDAVNGHDPINAVVENGTFMRLSRYFPRLGYQSDREIQDTFIRKKHDLYSPPTSLKTVESTEAPDHDAILLDLLVSTSHGQTVIATGQLTKQWAVGDRAYFHYQSGTPIPFRFAVASAKYASSRARHRGIDIQVFYHPNHGENVTHLIQQAKHTLDYCLDNFGEYSFPAIVFAEISAYTRGFAATAYPGTIYMAEDMIFHANLGADEQQDVINELASHELSHQWWGTHHLHPDECEGATMLTESLAMYTEMMLYKKVYGREKMQERLNLQEQIYAAERGFSAEPPLYKVGPEQAHIAYAKGALVMVKLSDLLGEGKVNEALRNFLLHYRFPLARPKSTDLIEEFLQVSNDDQRESIRKLFTSVEMF